MILKGTPYESNRGRQAEKRKASFQKIKQKSRKSKMQASEKVGNEEEPINLQRMTETDPTKSD